VDRDESRSGEVMKVYCQQGGWEEEAALKKVGHQVMRAKDVIEKYTCTIQHQQYYNSSEHQSGGDVDYPAVRFHESLKSALNPT